MSDDGVSARRLRHGRLCCAACGALAVALASPSLHAFCRTTEPRTPPPLCERGEPVAWPVPCVGIALNTLDLAAPDQDLSLLLRRHLPLAANAWSDASCGPSLRLVVGPEDTHDTALAFDGHNTVSVNRRWPPDPFHRPSTVAITVVTTDVATAAILDADVELNARSPDNPLGYLFGDGAPAWGVADLPSVVLHELGHVAGLAHADREDAVMSAGGGDLERQRRALTPDDVRGVCASYPVTPSRPRSAAGCAPDRPVAPPVAITGGAGCAVSPGARVRPLAGFVVVLTALCLRRASRRERRATPTLQGTNT